MWWPDFVQIFNRSLGPWLGSNARHIGLVPKTVAEDRQRGTGSVIVSFGPNSRSADMLRHERNYKRDSIEVVGCPIDCIASMLVVDILRSRPSQIVLSVTCDLEANIASFKLKVTGSIGRIV